jgi:hypothetical protein
MSEVRSFQPAGLCAQGAMENAAFYLALTEHALKNIRAVADSMVAALYSAGEANTHILHSATEGLSQRIAAARALATAAAPGDLLAAQAEFAHRAFERYAADARALRSTVMAGARACREPLLERLS